MKDCINGAAWRLSARVLTSKMGVKKEAKKLERVTQRELERLGVGGLMFVPDLKTVYEY